MRFQAWGLSAKHLSSMACPRSPGGFMAILLSGLFSGCASQGPPEAVRLHFGGQMCPKVLIFGMFVVTFRSPGAYVRTALLLQRELNLEGVQQHVFFCFSVIFR